MFETVENVPVWKVSGRLCFPEIVRFKTIFVLEVRIVFYDLITDLLNRFLLIRICILCNGLQRKANDCREENCRVGTMVTNPFVFPVCRENACGKITFTGGLKAFDLFQKKVHVFIHASKLTKADKKRNPALRAGFRKVNSRIFSDAFGDNFLHIRHHAG